VFLFRPLTRIALSLVLVAAVVPAAGQSLKPLPFNTKQPIVGHMWTAGSWAAFCMEETNRSLNGDEDTEDTVLVFVDLRTMSLVPTGLALDFTEVDNEESPPVAFGKGYAAFLVSEADQGGRDLNGDGKANGNVVGIVNLANRQSTNLGFAAHYLRFREDTLYFVRSEADAKQDLNGDRDLRDQVLSSYDPINRKFESLGMEADLGVGAAGDWIVTYTSESAQGGRDQNGDGDTLDVVAMLYSLSQKNWRSSGLEASGGGVLTPKLFAAGVEEGRQGKQDLNRDGDATDTVCVVYDLNTGKLFNTGQECGGGIAADDTVVGLVTRERMQGPQDPARQDLNKDGDNKDDVLQIYVLGSESVRNPGWDASGGIAAAGGRIAFSCDEMNQGKKDLNRDRDALDLVLMIYDPITNAVKSLGIATEGPLIAAGSRVAFKVPEADQRDTDLNGDRDLEDLVVHVMDVASEAPYNTRLASGQQMGIGPQAVVFPVSEFDQGNADLNGDRDADDDIGYVIRLSAEASK